MNKLTKIVATIGPATESEEMIAELIAHGVNVFRFNLKHSDLTWHAERIDRVKRISEEHHSPIATLIDLQGPEIRISIKYHAKDEFEVKKDEEILLGEEIPEGEKGFTISHPHIIEHLEKGAKVFVEDGRFEFEIIEKRNGAAVLKSHSEGVLKTRKSMNVPGVYFPLPALTDRDREALEMGKKHGVDFVALSFVRRAEDVDELKAEMAEHSFGAKIVSKIETKMAIDHLDEIIAVSDALMVARGDLGIELPIEEVPYYQKMMIKKSIEGGIPVITATQMLESMIENPFATRAEISDIANAVYDYTDAVMLSGETANGAYPLQTVETMYKTVRFAESKNSFDSRGIFSFEMDDQEDIICDAAYNLTLHFMGESELEGRSVDGYILFSQAGKTARTLSRYHAGIPIYTFVPDREIARSLALHFGIVPITRPEIFQKGKQVTKDDILNALAYLHQAGLVDPKKYYILLHGDQWMVEGKTSTIKIIAPTE